MQKSYFSEVKLYEYRSSHIEKCDGGSAHGEHGESGGTLDGVAVLTRSTVNSSLSCVTSFFVALGWSRLGILKGDSNAGLVVAVVRGVDIAVIGVRIKGLLVIDGGGLDTHVEEHEGGEFLEHLF